MNRGRWGVRTARCCVVYLAALCASSAVSAAADETDTDSKLIAEIVDVRRIWDAAPHNAFTDLVRHNDRWYCVFREGKAHVSPDGAIRVITSGDGQKWESAALIRSDNSDLRDPKITVTPEGLLMLSAAEAVNKPVDHTHQSLVWFSRDGRDWGQRIEIGDADYWLWRVVWHKGTAYSIGYGCRDDNQHIRLYASRDGRKFDTLVENLYDEGSPNETSLVFDRDDTCFCLLRRDGQPNSALLGTSAPPYEKWQWKDLQVRIGGPRMMQLPDGQLVAVVRRYDGGAHAALCQVDPEAGTLREIAKLPSGGDTSYAGMVWHDERLWISYYSSHEGKTSIYLAQVRFGP